MRSESGTESKGLSWSEKPAVQMPLCIKKAPNQGQRHDFAKLRCRSSSSAVAFFAAVWGSIPGLLEQARERPLPNQPGKFNHDLISPRVHQPCVQRRQNNALDDDRAGRETGHHYRPIWILPVGRSR